MKNLVCTIGILLWSSFVFSAPAIFVDEQPTSMGVSRIQADELESFSDIYSLREQRKVGVGASFLGWGGFIAAHIELNFQDDLSGRMVVGGGPGYQSVGVGVKWLPMETAVHPVFGFGVVDWFGTLSGNQRNPSPPSFLTDRVLTDSDRASGRFNHVFWVPSVGVEWIQLSGPGAGAGLYLDLMLLIEQPTLDQYVTASGGVVYYF